MRNQLKIVYGALTIVAMLGLTSTVQGVPAFARQTGLDCNSCHASPGYPTLNTFGQAFKASGYTQASEDNLMGDGEALSIPKTLNMSVVFKMNDEIGINGKTIENKLHAPDEIAFLSGGKVANNIGYLIESGFGGGFGNFKLVFAPEIGPVRLGIVPFYSDGLGPAYALETLSTDNADNIRLNEGKDFTSAQALMSWGGGNSASGVGLYVWHSFGFVNYTPFVENTGVMNPGGPVTKGVGHYIRAAVTPSFSGIDTALGFTMKTGTSNADYSAGKDSFGQPGTSMVTKFGYIAVDAQVMATLGIPLVFVATYASDTVASQSAFAVAVDAQVIQDLLSLTVGYRGDLSAVKAGSNVGVAAKFQVARNIRLAVDAFYGLESKGITIVPQIFGAF